MRRRTLIPKNPEAGIIVSIVLVILGRLIESHIIPTLDMVNPSIIQQHNRQGNF